MAVDLALTKNEKLPFPGKKRGQPLTFFPLHTRGEMIMKEAPKANALSRKLGNHPPLLDIHWDG
jgi:hypothetical protein